MSKALCRHFMATLLSCLVAMPAFAQTAVTKYAPMAAQIRRDCAADPSALHCFTIGSAAVSRRPILLVRVTAGLPSSSPADSPRLFVICRQHGDEPVSTQAALQWLGLCAAMPAAQLRQTLGPITVYIAPMANPDGADKLARLTGSWGDMNRDWGQFGLPETRALYAAFKQIAPAAVVDLHSWDSTDPFQANSVEAGLVNAPSSPESAQTAERMQDGMIKAIRTETGQTVSALSYSPEADTRLCHRFFAARGVPAVLVETAAGSSDSRAAMSGRVLYDLAALNGAIQSLRAIDSAVPPAPHSLFVASAETLAGRVSAPLSVLSPRPRFTAAQLAFVRARAVRLALGLYLVACLVLCAACGKSFATAWRSLLRRRRLAGTNAAYVSIRARHYPADQREATGKLIAASITRRRPIMRCR